MALNSTFVSGAVYTAQQANNFPFGIAGKSELALDKTFTTLTDSGLTVTWTANSTRQYKLTFFGNLTSSSAGLVQSYITDSSNVAIRETMSTIGGGSLFPQSTTVLLSGVTGSVTYKVRLVAGAGTGTLYGADSRPALAAVFMVEDVGLA
jgi:hypothetical protein